MFSFKIRGTRKFRPQKFLIFLILLREKLFTYLKHYYKKQTSKSKYTQNLFEM